MEEKGLVDYFENFLSKNSIFKNKTVLQSNYVPEEVLHRDEQIKQIAELMAPSLKMDRPSNLFVYGKTGTGKTLSVKYVLSQIMDVAKKQGLPIETIYLNCKLKKVADTEYRVIAHLARELGKAVPPTGLPTDEVYSLFYDGVDSKKRLVLLILDEVDQLVKKTGDGLLYNLTRINSELKQSQVSMIGISNDLMFTEGIDPRVKSSLSEEELVFPPYNAMQIQQILKSRSQKAFVDLDVCLGEGVIEKCAAYSAREHGDARRAIDLLRIAAELAEREEKDKVGIEHLDLAEEKIERDRVLDILKIQPKQFQATLYSIISVKSGDERAIFTGEAYEFYKNLCESVGLRPLTQRRISDIIAEMDMLGIVNAKVISKGRYGRTREITLSIPESLMPKAKEILAESLNLT